MQKKDFIDYLKIENQFQETPRDCGSCSHSVDEKTIGDWHCARNPDVKFPIEARNSCNKWESPF